MDILVKISVPEGEYCRESIKQCQYLADCYESSYCAWFGKHKFTQGKVKKLPECLAAPKAMEALSSCDICRKTEADLIDNRARIIKWDEKEFCHICEECEKEM